MLQGGNIMSNEEQIASLSTRVGKLVDDIYVVRAEIEEFKRMVSADIKKIVEQVSKNVGR